MIISAHFETVHQVIGVAEEPDHHKNLCDLGIGITELLHGSSVKFESGVAGVEGRDHHGNHFLGGSIDRALVHDGLVLVPISL